MMRPAYSKEEQAEDDHNQPVLLLPPPPPTNLKIDNVGTQNAQERRKFFWSRVLDLGLLAATEEIDAKKDCRNPVVPPIQE